MTPLRLIPGPKSLPLVGSLYLFKTVCKVADYHKILAGWNNEFGPVVRVQYGSASDTVIHLFEPDDAKEVHSKEGKMPFIRPLQESVNLYREMRKTSPGLGNTNGEEWYRLRSAVRPILLRPKEVQNYLQDVSKITDEFIHRLKKKTEKQHTVGDIRRELSKWSLEVAGWISFGRRLECMDGGKGEAQADKIYDVNRELFRLSAKLKFSLPLYKYFPTPSWKRFIMLENLITDYGVELVEEAIKNIRLGSRSCNYLQYLLGRPELSDQDIIIVTLSLFVDGLSTTVPTLVTILRCLAANPTIQEEVLEEVNKAFANGEISASSLNKIPLLKGVIKETQRMYPNATEVSRVIQSPANVTGGYQLPAGTNVSLNQSVHFRSEMYFDKPNTFDPRRWLREETSESIHNFLVLPFGYGTRSCAGRRFAEQDLYVSVAKIIQNFILEIPDDSPPLELIYETLLFPKEPVFINFRPR